MFIKYSSTKANIRFNCGYGFKFLWCFYAGPFRNPLADPGLIGISGAALFVAIIIVIFSNLLDGITGLYILSFAAFCGR